MVVNNSGYCTNCDNKVAFNTDFSTRLWPEYIPPGSTRATRLFADPDVRIQLVVLTCQYCGWSSTWLERSEWTNNRRTNSDSDAWQVFPQRPPRELHKSVPEIVRSLFREASVAESAGALRGAGALYRASIEKICADQGGSGRQLYDRINSIAEKLGPELTETMHETRLLGNYSLHDGVTFGSDEVADVADMIVEATMVLYQQPAERAEMRARRQRRREEHDSKS